MVSNVGTGNDSNGPVSMVVPANLKTLIRMIMKAFYAFELFLCMEMLMVYPCVKEEDLADLLRMDLKHVHQHLVNLKKEKFINERSIMETSSDGRQSKHSYFYINYKMMVNVIKYKLDKIRIQIESEEKQCTSRANFKCTSCSKTYSDLDTKDIFLTMTCLYCGAEVEEDISCLPNRSSRNLLAKFNTQMEIVFELLSRVEHVRLADDILRPETVDMTHVLERMMNTPNSANAAVVNPNFAKMGKSGMVKFDAMGMTKWSGDKTRHTDLLGQTRISINFDSTENNSSVRQKRELPSILLDHATTDDDWNNRDSELLNSIKTAADETLNNQNNSNSKTNNVKTKNDSDNSNSMNTANTANSVNNINQSSNNLNNKQSVENLEVAIMQKLLIHEKKSTSENNNDSLTNNSTNGNNAFSKKRDFESTNDLNALKNRKLAEINNGNNNNDFLSGNSYDKNDDLAIKKRKLNNGAESRNGLNNTNNKLHNGFHIINKNHSPNNMNLYHSKSYSDGSDRDDQDDESNSMCYNDMDDEDLSTPRVTVQNKHVRLDKLNAFLIKQMNETEKEFYINVCRQLYTEIYEI
jgi:transcription initiation factor TFIIE subunit alpha